MKLQDCLLRFERGVAAVALIFRDLESLQAAVMMELEVESMSGPGTLASLKQRCSMSATGPFSDLRASAAHVAE